MADSEHNVKIRITGIAGSAVSAFAKVTSSLNSIRIAASKVMTAFGVFGMAINGINTLIDGYRRLKEWMGRAAEQAKAVRHEIESAYYASAIANAAAAYEKLNASIARNLQLERERNEIVDGRKATERSLEDAALSLEKQEEIAALDPDAPDYAEKKRAVERKYESKASDVAEARASEDSRAKADRLYEQAAARDRDADALELKYKAAAAAEDRAVERNWAAGMAARSGNEADVKRAEETEKQWKEAHDFAKKIKEEMEKAREEAQAIRTRAGENAGGNLAAKLTNQAVQTEIRQRQKEDEAAKKKEAEKKKEEDDKKARDEASRKKADELAEENRRKLEKASALSGMADRLAAADSVGANRLTAMGLGSGVQGNGGMASDVRKIVDLMKQQVEETKKKNNAGDGAAVAVYGE